MLDPATYWRKKKDKRKKKNCNNFVAYIGCCCLPSLFLHALFCPLSHLVCVSLFYGVSARVCAPRLMELHTTTKEECVHFNLFIVKIILLLLVARTASHPQQPVCSSTPNVRCCICGIVGAASIRSCRNYEHERKT